MAPWYALTMERPPKTSSEQVYQGTFTVPTRMSRLAKIAAAEDEKSLSCWVGDLVKAELTRRGALSAARSSS